MRIASRPSPNRVSDARRFAWADQLPDLLDETAQPWFDGVRARSLSGAGVTAVPAFRRLATIAELHGRGP